jgi:hypothetical protein
MIILDGSGNINFFLMRKIYDLKKKMKRKKKVIKKPMID